MWDDPEVLIIWVLISLRRRGTPVTVGKNLRVRHEICARTFGKTAYFLKLTPVLWANRRLNRRSFVELFPCLEAYFGIERPCDSQCRIFVCVCFGQHENKGDEPKRRKRNVSETPHRLFVVVSYREMPLNYEDLDLWESESRVASDRMPTLPSRLNLSCT